MIHVISGHRDFQIKAGKTYWMPSGLVRCMNSETAFEPHEIRYDGQPVKKVRIQPLFNGKRRLGIHKVSLIHDVEIDGHMTEAVFYEAYVDSAARTELMDMLHRSPWPSDNGGNIRDYLFYEEWLGEILGW